jgi:predicted small lipoprotein YifL
MAGQTRGFEFVEVMRRSFRPVAVRVTCALLAGALAGCGLKGPLYLPEKAGGIVTRPAQAPSETTSAPNSPQTVDSPQAGDTPAPEVTAPPAGDEKKDPDKKEKGTAPSPR